MTTLPDADSINLPPTLMAVLIDHDDSHNKVKRVSSLIPNSGQCQSLVWQGFSHSAVAGKQLLKFY